MGHLQRMAGVSRELEQAGERVTWSVPRRYVESARKLWSRVTENPDTSKPKPAVIAPGNLAEILQNEGWHSADRLSAVVAQWREKFIFEKAERLVLDFAPNALLAAVASSREVDVVGTGFYIPPNTDSSPAFRDDHGVYPDRLRWAEEKLVSVVGQVLNRPIVRLSDVFHHSGVQNHLVSYAQWDHYPQRNGAYYCGLVTPFSGARVAWPDTHRRRLFAYLRPFPGLRALLEFMHLNEACVQVHGNAAVAETVRKANLPGITFCRRPVDERSIAESGAVMVNHAGHDGTVKAVLAGIALLQLPLTVEQSLTAQNAQKLGVSECANAGSPGTFAAELERLLDKQAEREKAAHEWTVSQQPVNCNLHRLIDQLMR